MNTTTPRERPILFSGPMVRAILSGTKTQTRRVLESRGLYPHGAFWDHVGYVPALDTRMSIGNALAGQAWAFAHRETGLVADNSPAFQCPYGKPGDRLWVRETFQTGEYAQNEPRGAVYRATDPEWETECDGWKWKPSIFMPRALSRLTLEITGIRVERVQDISEGDAVTEGCTAEVETPFDYWQGYSTRLLDRYGNNAHQMIPKANWPEPPPWLTEVRTHKGMQGSNISAVAKYRSLWDSINAARDGGKYAWATNPFVWIVEFKRV